MPWCEASHPACSASCALIAQLWCFRGFSINLQPWSCWKGSQLRHLLLLSATVLWNNHKQHGGDSKYYFGPFIRTLWLSCFLCIHWRESLFSPLLEFCSESYPREVIRHRALLRGSGSPCEANPLQWLWKTWAKVSQLSCVNICCTDRQEKKHRCQEANKIQTRSMTPAYPLYK